ncbi:MAG: type II toxin-antitoxin system HicB family antitoxin [Rudanella sp.]|nr:type II toxin-antitoxin system HicB family antitoxin [Rudanella sp.]
METYIVVIQQAESNFGVYSPDVLGCVATGVTVEETVVNMKEALHFHLESMLEDGEGMPVRKGLSYYLNEEEPIAEPGDFILLMAVELPHQQPA